MLKRMIAALLTLMLATMLLPKAALAADLPSPNPNGATIPSISTSDTLAINDGTVTNNFGTITLNGPNGTVADNRGTVETNNGTVTGNNSILTDNNGIVTSNNAGGSVETNDGIISANNNNAFVTNNYGTVYNKGGNLYLGTIQAFGTVTNNYGTVYNDRGLVCINYSTGVANSGVVYNDHGQVDENGPGSTVHTFGGKVFENAGVVNRYGAGGIVGNNGGTTYQYRRVTISGTSVEHVEISGVTDILFDAKWAREDIGVTLTPKSGYYFTSQPSAIGCDVVADGEAYRVTGISADTTITLGGVSTATPVTFSGLTANGGDTETTSLLTLTFNHDIADLAVGDLTVTGAIKGALTEEAATGVYTLSVSDITVADHGSVSVAVQKRGFAFTPTNKTVAVRKYTPPPATYTITYDANGGTGTMTSGTTTQGAAFTLPACGFTAPTGQRFKEWAIGSTSGTKVAAGNTHTFTANTTVYAIWENIPPATYTVTYNANGGTGTMTSGTATQGAAFTLPACGFTAPTGQRFKEWAIGSTSGTKVAAGNTHTFTANTTVYAIWENIPPATYTVTYNANGGTGTMTSGTATQGAAFTLPACGFTAPTGQRFKEWAIGSTSGTKVAAGNTHAFTANTTVFAIWENIPPATYNVTLNFKKDGVAFTGLSVSIENQGSTYPLAENPGESGQYTNAAVPNGTYTIRLAGESTNKAVTVNGAGGSATLEYFTVTFNANGGTPAPTVHVVIKGGKAAAPTVSKAPFTLDGWYSDSALTTLWDFDTNTVTGTTALYAKWLSGNTAPAFTMHPAAQTVTEGTATTFTITVTGNPAPTLQWQVSTDNGASWSNITGATSASFTTPATTTAMNGYRYHCIASNGTLPDATSNTATLTVNVAPVVVPTVSVSPAKVFSQGNAPQITITVGAGITAFGLGNFGSVQMGSQGGALTLLADRTDYDKAAGSIIITLHQAYLNRLTPGAYTLQINLTGTGYPSFVQTTIIVNTPGAVEDVSENVPKTGDSTPIALCIGSALLAGALLAMRRTRRKKEPATD